MHVLVGEGLPKLTKQPLAWEAGCLDLHEVPWDAPAAQLLGTQRTYPRSPGVLWGSPHGSRYEHGCRCLAGVGRAAGFGKGTYLQTCTHREKNAWGLQCSASSYRASPGSQHDFKLII